MERAVSSSVSIRAAAPSDTSEQSVRFSGGATYGFRSDRVRQKSKPRSAVALEIRLGDAAEHAGEPGGDVAFLAPVAGGEQDVADLRAGRGGHLLGPHHQREAAAPGGQEVARAVDGGGAGGAGVLEPRRRLVAQRRQRLQDHGAGEVLLGEAVVEQADEAGVDLLRRDAGILDRGSGDPADQAFDIRVFQLAERTMRPADDTSLGHRVPLRRRFAVTLA
jgi:hypothetical protein